MLGSILRFISGRNRGWLVASGMVGLLFVAGLAFSLFENTAASRAALSLGIEEADETPALPAGPGLDPDDGLYDPDALKEQKVPRAGGQMDRTSPASRPQPASNASGAGDGSPNTTSPGTVPPASTEAPTGAPEAPDGPPSDDRPGTGTPTKPPHSWGGGESECPGR